MSESMVERVARAIRAVMRREDDTEPTVETRYARAAIEAMREPTEEMIEDGCRAIYGPTWDGPLDKMPGPEMKDVWRKYPRLSFPAMIDAALKEKP